MKKCWILALSVVLVATSCSPFQVQTDYSKSVNFVGYKTYQLRVKDLELNDIDKDRVSGEVSRQLELKGLVGSNAPDLIINVKANHKQVTDVQSYPYGYFGWWSPWMFGFGRTWTSSYNRGSLTIDIIDAKTQKLVWQGIGDGISVDSPKKKQKEIPQVVTEIMAKYPPVK